MGASLAQRLGCQKGKAAKIPRLDGRRVGECGHTDHGSCLEVREVAFTLTIYIDGVAYDDRGSTKVGKLVIGAAPNSMRAEDITGETGEDLAPQLVKGHVEVDLTDEESEEVRRLEQLGWGKVEAIRKVLSADDALSRALSGEGKVVLDLSGKVDESEFSGYLHSP